MGPHTEEDHRRTEEDRRLRFKIVASTYKIIPATPKDYEDLLMVRYSFFFYLRFFVCFIVFVCVSMNYSFIPSPT